jgi:hypothetical protein
VNAPVNCRVKSLYFLHGCGYEAPVSFAEYVMHDERGNSSRVPLVPLGLPQRTAHKHLRGLKPNLQDWWSGYPQRDFPHAHHVTVYNPADPAGYERTLYSLEWINPHPEDEIRYVEVRVDPKAGPTLALIAVTALLAGD